ncbi:hypothetical protein B0T16DRAFT_450802 [Cercophora newfieldiana]|uniref:Uncharacterized protein n=1 Tax=Cercophora newfieldiana TaxID=92897 RepID=A0AA39YNX1_9PEZI|nr:hypothetical protein B0T16DRAFT_450802 [Cercophora newfieldiana]
MSPSKLKSSLQSFWNQVTRGTKTTTIPWHCCELEFEWDGNSLGHTIYISRSLVPRASRKLPSIPEDWKFAVSVQDAFVAAFDREGNEVQCGCKMTVKPVEGLTETHKLSITRRRGGRPEVTCQEHKIFVDMSVCLVADYVLSKEALEEWKERAFAARRRKHCCFEDSLCRGSRRRDIWELVTIPEEEASDLP